MKKISFIIFTLSILFGMSSCQDYFLDLEPLDQKTDVVYFKKPSDFKEYTNGFYSQLIGWKSPYGGNSIYQYMDVSSDLETSFLFSSDLGRGTINIKESDNRWSKNYEFIRVTNILLAKAEAYAGDKDEIRQYTSEAYFFRANAYFNLLKFFGGVPIVTRVLDVDSRELFASRNSRYEVVDLILSDLNKAITGLPTEQSIVTSEKGRVSKWAAEAFKARVLLYEATWRKYNGTSTDFVGSAVPANDQINDFLTECVVLCKDVMDNGGYEIWNYNDNTTIKDQSNLYLFNLEDAGSNPAGLTKASNKEFILYGVYDFNLRQAGINVSHTMGQFAPSRKFIDMFLCTDGLPALKSPLFLGYHSIADEYKNRDFRLSCYVHGGDVPTNGSVELKLGMSGYGNSKFASYKYGTYRTANQESHNYPIIRLAEVYLNYAEALIELNGSITDDQIDESINKIRERAGVADLTNALASVYNMDIKEEIRRERTIELYLEGFRFDDLKRWGIAEDALNASRCGRVVGDASYPTEFRNELGNATDKYTPNAFVWGEEEVETAAGSLKCVVISSSSNHSFSKMHYLWPIPQDQINLNPVLTQNPGYN